MTMRYSHLSKKTLQNAVDKLTSFCYTEPEFGTHLAH
jgi:hypothetical protein